MSVIRRTAVAGSAAALVLGVVAIAPADAETVRIHDGRDTSAVQELVAVKIKHEQRLDVVMRFSNNYHRQGEYPFSIYLDTDRNDPGPEYVLASHFNSVWKTEGWNTALGDRVDCSLRGYANWRKHTIRMSFGHGCMEGYTGPVRVSVSASGQADDLSFVQDYAPAKHRFSAPVARY